MNKIYALSAELTVGPEPSASELADLAASGVRMVISNRPDDEDGVLLASAQMTEAAETCGLAFEHIPVEGRNPLEGSVVAFADALEDAEGPVYAYCKTGGRSAALWALASVRGFDNATLIEKCADGGHDIAMLEPKLTSRRILLEDEDD